MTGMKVGLVGCGGRGTGAANQAINADPGVMLWAMGDVYEDRLKNSFNGLKNQHGTRVMVGEERRVRRASTRSTRCWRAGSTW